MVAMNKVTGELSKIAKDVAEETFEGGRAKLQELEESLEEWIREYPIRPVLLAAAVGFALGLMLTRR